MFEEASGDIAEAESKTEETRSFIKKVRHNLVVEKRNDCLLEITKRYFVTSDNNSRAFIASKGCFQGVIGRY